MSESGCWLVADVGGTHTRFALAETRGKEFRLDERREMLTADCVSFEEALSEYLACIGSCRLSKVCVAIAGPVSQGKASLTNGRWKVSATEIACQLGLEDALVVNDFYAVAAALTHLRAEDLKPIGVVDADVDARAGLRKVVLGPGTGFGVAALVAQAGEWRVIASEWGHAALAPTDALELEVLQILLDRFSYVTWEHALSGPGLENLYQAVSVAWGAQDGGLKAPEITARALAHDPVCHQTLELFCSMLGTAAGSAASTFCAEGGVYLAGGILPRIPEFLAASHFRERFEAATAMLDCLAGIPTHLVMSTDVGLLGAAVALAALATS